MSEKQKALRSPWVIAWIGMFVIFVVANIIMIYLAADRPGLVVDDYYERGQDYEENMLKRLAKDPGWKMKIDAPEFVDVGKPATFNFSVIAEHCDRTRIDVAGYHVGTGYLVKRVFKAADRRGFPVCHLRADIVDRDLQLSGFLRAK